MIYKNTLIQYKYSFHIHITRARDAEPPKGGSAPQVFHQSLSNFELTFSQANQTILSHSYQVSWVFWTASSRNTSSVCRGVDSKRFWFPCESDTSFSFFSVFLVFWTTSSPNPQSVSRTVDNVQSYASRVSPTIRSYDFSFHSLLDGIKFKNIQGC